MAEHYRTCKQLKEILTNHTLDSKTTNSFSTVNSEKMMQRLLTRYMTWKKAMRNASSVLFGSKSTTNVPIIPIIPVVPVVPIAANKPISNGARNANVPPPKRRRTRGGAVAATGGTRLNFENEEVEAIINPDDLSKM